MLIQLILLGCFVLISENISQQTSTETFTWRLEGSTLWSWSVNSLSKLTSGGKEIHLKDMQIQTNWRSSVGLLPCYVQYAQNTLGHSIPLHKLFIPCTARSCYCLWGPPWVAEHGASEVQAEILQLPCSSNAKTAEFVCVRCFTRVERTERLLTGLNFKYLILLSPGFFLLPTGRIRLRAVQNC